MLSMSIIS